MVRRRSTVRFRNGAPLKDQVSAHCTAYPTPRTGALPYWEESGRSCPPGPTEQARSAREGHRVALPGSAAETRGLRAVSWGCAFNGVLARWPYGHEMVTVLEHIGEPWQWKAGLNRPLWLTGRIIMASLSRSGPGSPLPLDRADLLQSAREANRVCGNRSCLARYRAQHSAIVFTRYRR